MTTDEQKIDPRTDRCADAPEGECWWCEPWVTAFFEADRCLPGGA